MTVTNRLPSVAHVDRTFVLDGGRLVEQGTHGELLERNGVYRRLWGVPLLAGLPDALLDELAEHFGTERFDAERVVFAQGDPGDTLYVIVRGAIDVLHATGSGWPTVLRVLEDGDYFGELALLDGVPRSGTVRTRTPCLFVTLARQHFSRLLGAAPDLRADLERFAAARRASTPA